MNTTLSSYIFRKALSSVILCLILLSLSGTWGKASAQSDIRINLSLKNTDLKTILKEIKAQTQFDFLYNAGEINDKTRISSLLLQNADIETTLQTCLKPLGINYVIQDKIIVLQKQPAPSGQQVRTLQGIVVDKSRLPLPGVTVKLKGTILGTSTDSEGMFFLTIPVTKETPELLFSFVGMQTTSYTSWMTKKSASLCMKV